METQFEIHSHLEKKHYVEYYRYILNKRILWVVIYILACLLSLVLFLVSNKLRWLLYGCFFAVYAVWIYFRPWLVAGKQVKRETKFEGTETLESVTKFGDVICDETKTQSVNISYDKLEAIRIAKHVIILTDVRKMAFILDKNGFVKGTFEEFLPFIQEKCPQLKLPKW